MDKERIALWLSALGGLVFSVLAFAFFLPTHSEAILLDGFYSLAGFVVGLLSLRVARLVQQPDDEHFPFGYAAFEPMLNTVKGLILLAVCVFAFSSAVGAVLDGGRQVELGWSLVYAIIATVGCFGIALIALWVAKKTGSQLVSVDARTWLVDGFISLVVALAFGAAILLEDTPWEHLVPYVDPALVILMTIFMVVLPVRIVLRGAGELLKTAPEDAVQEETRSRVGAVLDAADLPSRVIRMVRVGREFWVLIHVLVPDGQHVQTVAGLDEIRAQVVEAVAEVEPGMIVDVVFTGREEWL
jgi:cation diffusion facilitator family transporter